MTAERKSLLDALRQRFDAQPLPTDGPEYHANLAFWKEGVRALLAQLEAEVDVGHLGRAYLAKQSAIAQRALDGLPYV